MLFQKPRNKGYTAIVVAALVTLVTVCIDQLTKWLAVEYLMPVGDIPIIKDVLHLTYIENEGGAFGLLQNQMELFIAVTAVIAIISWFAIIKYRKNIHIIFLITLPMITGGGIGNIIDRIAKGYVVDFVYFKLINFAVFNFADSCICVGAAILLIYVIFFSGRKDTQLEAARSGEPKT